MTHRTDTILLPADVSRCNPTRACGRRESCARYLASIPQGTPLTDFSSLMYCSMYISADSTKRQPKKSTQTVHEAPGWMK